MSKLAHSHQPSMDEIERRALKEPIPKDEPPAEGPWDGIPENIYGEENEHEDRDHS